MTSPALAHDAALVTLDRGADRSGPVISLDKTQRTVFVLVIAAIVTAVAAPYPLTKIILGGTLALYWATLLFNFDERFVGLFVLLLPTLVLAPLETLGIPGLNWQTVFLDDLSRRCRQHASHRRHGSPCPAGWRTSQSFSFWRQRMPGWRGRKPPGRC